MQTQDFRVVRRNQTNVHFPLASIPSFGFHYFKAFKPSLKEIQLDYGFNPLSWTFGSKHPLQPLRDISLLNNPSNDTPYLRIPK